MWRNWNPFKRRTEENDSENQDEASDGKENTADISARGLAIPTDVSGNVGVNGLNSLNNYVTKQTNGYNNVEDNSYLQSSFEDDSLYNVSGGSRNQTEINTHNQNVYTQPSPSLRRSVTTSPFTQSGNKNLPRDSSMAMKNENMNKSFSGVYGPLLSSPIVPKVRRALESSAGLKSPQTSVQARGRSVGRSTSLNYGSGNPTKSTAGQVPWVRLKRRESVALADIVSGNTPQSPNTVKLAAPELRLLPAAPNFKTTPVIVTTDHNRARVVDTQTVVSALREKRKRFGANSRDDSLSEDTWITAAKRRRQDSSQSNASSVSIPSMPECLPNLMGTPGISLLHIENLKDQRPSTVPAMDAFVSRHQREFGLGGDIIGRKPQQQIYIHRQQQQEDQDARNKQNSKSVLRSIQSSLSSSLRARTNLSILQQSGLDLKRIRQLSEHHDASRKMSISSDVSLLDQSGDEPQLKVPRQTSVTVTAVTSTPASTERSLPVSSADKNAGAVSSQIKQKVAEGVVLKKHNLSIGASSSPARPKQTLPMNALVSTSDFEHDRQKEYKRRVLDLLDEEEAVERSDVVCLTVSSTAAALMTSSVSAPTIFPGLPVSIEASSAATSAAISASLDSLNKLVQSAGAAVPSPTTTGSLAPVTSTNTLTQLLNSSEGKPQASTGSAPFIQNKEVSFGGFMSSAASSQNNSTEVSSPSTAVSSLSGGFQFGVSSTTAATVALTQSTSQNTTGGFQMNFPTPISSGILNSTTSSAAPTTSVVSTGSGQQATGVGFNFNTGTATSQLNATTVGSSAGGQQSASTGYNFSTGTGSTPQPNTNTVGSAAGQQATSTGFHFSTGTDSTSQPNTFGSAISGQQATSSGFNFNTGTHSASQTISNIFGSTAGGSAFSVAGQTSVATDFGTKGMNLLSNTAQNPENSFTSKVLSAPSISAPETMDPSRAGSGIFGSGVHQGVASSPGSFSLSSTLQAFAATQSGGEDSFTKQTRSNTQGQGFLFASTPSSSAPASGMFSFGTPSSTASIPSGFSFGSAGGSNTPTGNFATVTASLAPSTGNSTTAKLGFNFGATNTAAATTSQQPGGLSFGTVSTNSAPFNPVSGIAASTGWTNTVGSGGFTNQPANSDLKGFGSNTLTTSSTSAFTAGGSHPQNIFTPVTTSSIPSLLSSGGSVFGTSSQAPLRTQQPFGSGTATPAFSLFGTTTAATSTGSFTFGQSAASSVQSKPFAFGAVSTQPGVSNTFGAMSTQPGVSNTFGAMSAQPGASNTFGAMSTQHGASNTFGAMSAQPGASNTFGAMSAQPGASNTFGTVSTQPGASNTFGAMSTQPGASNTFGAVSAQSGVSNTFGAVSTQPGASNSFGGALGGGTIATSSSIFGNIGSPSPAAGVTSVFGSGTTSAFGNSSVSSPFRSAVPTTSPPAFGSTTTASAFGTMNSQTSSVFGATSQVGQASSVFGAPVSSSNQPFAFGGGAGSGLQSAPLQTPAFGSNTGTAFGSSSTVAGSSAFGVKPAPPSFGAATANPATLFGTSTPSSSTATSPTFGSSFGMSTSFGATPNTGKPTFGNTTAGFGTHGVQPFGASTQSSSFGSASQNPAQQNVFGSAPQNPPPAFGSQQGSLQTAGSGSFGGVDSGSRGANMFGAAKPNQFGATATTQASFNFCAAQPAPFNTQNASSAFNFGQSGNQPAATGGAGFNFAAQTPTRPAFQAPSAPGFNFAPVGSTPTFNFSGTPSTPNPFTPQTPTSAPRHRAAARRPNRRGGTRR